MCFMFCLCLVYGILFVFFFFFKQKTAYEMRISDWSSDVCSSDLLEQAVDVGGSDQVGAADHMGHPHRGIVERAREMIAGGRILAREDDIAVGTRVGAAHPLPRLLPHQIAGEIGRAHV